MGEGGTTAPRNRQVEAVREGPTELNLLAVAQEVAARQVTTGLRRGAMPTRITMAWAVTGRAAPATAPKAVGRAIHPLHGLPLTGRAVEGAAGGIHGGSM